MMNDPFVYEQSDKFAARVTKMAADDRGRIDALYRLALGRAAHSEEIDDALDYVRQCTAKLTEAGVAPAAQTRGAMASFARVIFASNEFLFLE
jgi:hypothetical protein